MTSILAQYLPNLITQSNQTSPANFLKQLAEQFADNIVFSSSFSNEDQVITHLIAQEQIAIQIFTLDTGRLFPETYSVWKATIDRYQIPIKAYYPAHDLLESFVTEKGPNAFYESVENRKQCCNIRKIIPLKRAIAGKQIWVTGLRAEHSATRQDLNNLEWDETNQLIKYHPLLNWTTEQVNQFVQENNIPSNPLHSKGFVSIGCAPCTRAIQQGEDFRAGRWWWEDASKKECGLHEHKS